MPAGRSPELKNKVRLRLLSVWVATNLKALLLSMMYVDVTGESPIPSAKIQPYTSTAVPSPVAEGVNSN